MVKRVYVVLIGALCVRLIQNIPNLTLFGAQHAASKHLMFAFLNTFFKKRRLHYLYQLAFIFGLKNPFGLNFFFDSLFYMPHCAKAY